MGTSFGQNLQAVLSKRCSDFVASDGVLDANPAVLLGRIGFLLGRVGF